MHRILSITLLFLFAAAGVQAQRLPERSLVRKGNRQYNKGEYEASIGRYEEALKAAPGQFEATYNLGNALYKAERFDRAEQTMVQAAADSLRSDAERAEAFYNLGNAQFKQQKYKEALESYKQSLRLNPADMEAKYNYAYTKRLLDQDQPTPSGCWIRIRTVAAGTTSKTRTRIRTSRTSRTNSSKTRVRTRIRTKNRISRTRTSRIRARTRRIKTENPINRNRARVNRPLRASPRKSRSRCSTPSRPRRTRPRRNSRRRPRASWSAARKGGQDPGETQGEGQGRRGPRQEKLVKSRKPCISLHPIICGCSYSSPR